MKTIPAKKISEELIAQNHHITIAEMDQLMKMIQKEMQPVSKAIALVTAEHTSKTLLVARCGIGPQCLFKVKALTVFLSVLFYKRGRTSPASGIGGTRQNRADNPTLFEKNGKEVSRGNAFIPGNS